ncbi:MAG: hypothetical protein RLZZ37_338 [Actinomycetota bacterium]|jgi:hypothetical protein
MPSKLKKSKKAQHSNIPNPIWMFPALFIGALIVIGISKVLAAASGSTIEVTLPSSTSIAANATEQDFNFSANTAGTDPIELPSGWTSSQYIAVEVSVTNPVSNPSEAQLDNAPVYRNVDGSNNPLCRVNIGSASDAASSTPGTNYGETAQTTLTVNSEAIVIIGDRTPSVTINGTYANILSVLANIRISCTSGNFVGRYVRLGVVPSESPISFQNNAENVTINSSLYYLFSTQRYYRFQRETTITTDSNTTDRLKQLWDDAKARTISVDGNANSGQTRYGWVATLTERDEIELADRLGTGYAPMIGLTDFGGPVDGSTSYTWNWDTTAWGTAPSPSTCNTFEANIRWLGPDSWCTRVPAPYWNWDASAFQNDDWSLCSNVWQNSASCSGGVTATATINFNSTNTTTNGWGLYHAWHISGSRVDEPNSSGDYFYTGYSSGGNVGWDDAGVSDNNERSDARNKTDTHNFYIAEFCAPNSPCTPPGAAVASTRLRIDQTITFTGASSSYNTENVNLTAATTTSNLTISYASNDSNICTVNSSAVVTLVSRGTCTITASQSGNDSYNAATSVSQSFTSNFGPIFSGVNTSCTGIGQLENGSFETFSLGTAGTVGGGNNNPTGSWHGYAGGPAQILFLDIDANLNQNVDPWNTTASNKIIEIQRAVSGSIDTAGTQDFDSTNFSPHDGIYMAELNATQTSALYQDISTLPGSILRWEIFHRGRKYTATANDGDEMKVQIGSTSATGYGSASAQSAIDQTPESGFDVDATGTSGSISGTTIKSERSDGWYRVRGVYQVPSGQTTTRFAFSAISGLHSIGVGNLLDNISFTPNVACPFTKTIIKGRTATLNVFGDENLTDAEESLGATDSTIGSTISITSGSGSITRVNSDRSMQFTAPNSTGTSVVRFRITNTFGDTSDADATFNIVDDLTQTAPTIIPVDPRAPFVDLPQIDILGSSVSKALLCYRQSQSNGTDLSSGHSLVTTVRTTSSNTISNDASTSEVSINGTIANVETSSSSIRITNSNGGAVLDSNTSKYLRVRVSGDDDLSADNCTNGSSTDQSKVIELRPVVLETTRKIDINVD